MNNGCLLVALSWINLLSFPIFFFVFFFDNECVQRFIEWLKLVSVLYVSKFLNNEIINLPDNPYYFFNETPAKVDQPSKGFSFFRRRSSSSSSTKSIKSPKGTFNSTSLNPEVLGRKGSLRSLLRPNVTSGTHIGGHAKEPCLSNGFSTVGYRGSQNQYRCRLGSYNESASYHENDDVFVSPRYIERKKLNEKETVF